MEESKVTIEKQIQMLTKIEKKSRLMRNIEVNEAERLEAVIRQYQLSELMKEDKTKDIVEEKERNEVETANVPHVAGKYDITGGPYVGKQDESETKDL